MYYGTIISAILGSISSLFIVFSDSLVLFIVRLRFISAYIRVVSDRRVRGKRNRER